MVNLKTKRYVLMPDSKFKFYWNLVITSMLLYTATYVPYRVSFIDAYPVSMIAMDTLMDGLFFLDMFVTLFSAYETKKLEIEVRYKQIAINYL